MSSNEDATIYADLDLSAASSRRQLTAKSVTLQEETVYADISMFQAEAKDTTLPEDSHGRRNKDRHSNFDTAGSNPRRYSYHQFLYNSLDQLAIPLF